MKGLSLIVMLTFVITVVLGYMPNVQPIKGDWTGTIYIKSDGSIYPTNAPIDTNDNVTYTLKSNILSSANGIVVQRSHVIINGAGLLLQGSGGVSTNGIFLDSVANVTIKNMLIRNFGTGIRCEYSSYNVMKNLKITGNAFGIYLVFSSRNNTIIDDEITHNEETGIWISGDSHGSIVIRNNITNNENGISLGSSNNIIGENNIISNKIGLDMHSWPERASYNRVYNNIFIGNGIWVVGLYANSVDGNLVNGKPLVYLEDASNYTVSEAGQVVLINCDRIKIEGLNLSCATIGVQLIGTKNSMITRNYITGNSHYGIRLINSFNNLIAGNEIIGNGEYSIWLLESPNNVIELNKIESNKVGVYIYHCSYNRIYHNNFIRNQIQAMISASGYINYWDDGYPSGGNYWSNYLVIDKKSGVNQDESGSDGIVDSWYTFSHDCVDHYPLMGMLFYFNATSEFHVQIICNSSISHFRVNGNTITFNVTDGSGANGFCRICIPTALMNMPYEVFVDGVKVSYSLLQFSNETHNYIYFSYTHPAHEVQIVPEYASLLFLFQPLFMTFVLRTLKIWWDHRDLNKIRRNAPVG